MQRVGSTILALMCAAPTGAQTFPDAIRLSGDARARLQTVDRRADTDATALTLRLQLAAEADLDAKTTVLGELEGSLALIDDFDDGVRQAGRAFIPDPEGLELNRLQLSTEAIPDTRITLGRQRIALDDWRFIGAFPFRQNDQTFDAVRAELTSLGPGIADVIYFGRVLRPLGDDNVGGRFTGNSFAFNYNLPTPVGRVTAFHYRFDIETGPEGPLRHSFSNKVTGARLFGRRDGPVSASWDLSYATQSDHASRTEDFQADYWLAEGSLARQGTSLTLRAEELGSDLTPTGERVAFQTPLASLHRFQGLADQFLVIPNVGVRDLSIRLQQDFPDIGAVSAIRGFIRYHDFNASTGGADLGTEWDVSLGATLPGGQRFAFEYADYDAGTFSSDTRVLSLSLQWGF